jgi:3-oxoacyl-[acyl-carrier-protein] synthase-3
MGTRIESAATAVERGRLRGRGALHLADTAARRCLERAGREAGELDLLINTGIYKDANAAEPALATIIQQDIGANPSRQLELRHGTFAFDVLNGGCGVVTAARLLATFVGHGTAQRALIVASDVDPFPHTSRAFPFTPAGGAMLVTHTDGDTGFRAFELRTFAAHADLFEATVHWAPRAGWLRRGRNIVEVREAPELAPRCVELATEVVTGFLARQALVPDDIDLVIASQYPSRFALDIADRLGIPRTRVPRVRPELASSHTAGPIAALEAAFERGQLAHARHTLFVTVGAGITVGVALYVGAPA